MLLIGKVSTVDVETGFVRVTFPDREDAVSGPIPVLTPGGWAKSNALPEVGEGVLCVFPSGNLRNGFCLGSYWKKSALPPGDPASQHGTWFEDGSYVYYDRAGKMLHIQAAGGVHIDGNLIVSGSVTRGGVVL